jgi:hypothetical protein
VVTIAATILADSATHRPAQRQATVASDIWIMAIAATAPVAIVTIAETIVVRALAIVRAATVTTAVPSATAAVAAAVPA